MTVCKTIAECRAERAKLGKLAFVPTMGALHAGHASLMTLAQRHAPRVAVSIFVNPTQFGPSEDFTKYPRPIEADLELCEKAGVDLVFNPSPAEMYPEGSPDISVDLPQITTVLEGKHRPGHFKGVCQVVAKLFNIVQPQVACFGMKDFQQLCVLQNMVKALDFPIQIIPCPIIRDPDGLAMSSRNRYLSPDERKRALSISRGLMAAKQEVAGGVVQTNRLVTLVQTSILTPTGDAHVPVSIDYVAAVDPVTFKPKELVDTPVLLAVACRVGATRLIDNIILELPGK